MTIQKNITIILLFIFIFILNGCTLIRMGQETSEKIKTSTTFGYQNGIQHDRVRNVKDHIVDENDFVIIAESPLKTLYMLRNKSNFGRFSMLSDLVDYCEDIGGTVQFGKQFGASITADFDSLDFEFSSLKDDYKSNRLAGYGGWMKCIGSNDDFEVKRKSRSDYFLITHTKEQLQGYSLRWYMAYYDLEELDLESLNIGVFTYSAFVQLTGACLYNKGTSTIANHFTNDTETDLDNYLLERLDPLNGQRAYVLASGHLRCSYNDPDKKDLIFDIAYSQKYQKLLYTKRP